MHDVDLILTLTGGLAAALVCGIITLRLGLSPIVGYLLAGFVVGPNTPGFIADRELADQLAEIGVILLMFGVGLQFHIEELMAVRKIAIPGALGQITLATLLGALVGVVHGWSWSAGLVFGLAISVASTVVLLRILADHGDLHTPSGHIAVGWLVVEDLFTVFILVLLPQIFAPGHAVTAVTILQSSLLAAVKMGAMVILLLVGGGRLIPWGLEVAAATRSRELFTLTVLVLALGIAVGAAKLFGVSMALGAFLAGMVVGRSEFSLRAATDALPMRDAFAVLFFVSVGMLFDPHQLVESPGLIAATIAIVLIGKPLASVIIVLALGRAPRVAVSVGVALAQIGEFSFILATAGRHLKILDETATNTLVTAAIVSITLNPLLYRLIGPLETVLGRVIPARILEALQPAANSVSSDQSHRNSRDESHNHHAIVVGYGPVGRTLASLLSANHIEPTIVELNLETVRRLARSGITAVYGDAALAETLERAQVSRAVALILSSSTMPGRGEAIRIARELNPRIWIFAHAHYLRELPALADAQADAVFSGEGEVALAMTESLLARLGATPDQIDRERSRIRSELFDDPSASDRSPSSSADANELPSDLIEG
jgi:CPA2 family monovalent cation:H+ antiporter-2